MTESDWYWQYVPDLNQWHLHTPGYEPEVSFKVGLVEEGMISAFHKKTTLPQGVKEILAKMLLYLNLYAELDKGVTTILISRHEVEKAAVKVEFIKKLSERKGVQNVTN